LPTMKSTADALASLQALSEVVPEMRAGQLMAALGEVCVDLHGRGLWDVEDSELLKAISRFRQGVSESAVLRTLLVK